MGGTFPLIALLVVAVIVQYVVSATDCLTTNCELDARKECQTLAKSVFCNMKFRQIKQVNITAASFPRDVQEIHISDAENITFEPDAIASLTSLQVIEITNVNTLVLLSRSLASDKTTAERPIELTILRVKNLEIYPYTFAGWRMNSSITIEVGDCQLLPFSIANAQLRSLDVINVQSLVVHESAFSEGSVVEQMNMHTIRALSMNSGAFAAKAPVHSMLFWDIENLFMDSSALSTNARIREVRLELVKHLTIEAGGIQADIAELRLDKVAMETCGGKAFGGIHGSLSVSSVYIKRMRKHCMSASWQMKELIIEDSRFDQIETSAIYGRVTKVEIKNSIFGTMEKEGLQLNVTELYVENSYINEVSQDSFRVHADSVITIRNCTIDTLHKDAFRSLKVKKGSDSAHNRLQLDNIHIKHPQRGSLQFDQNQRVTVNEVTTDIPCTCDIATALGMDMSSRDTFWINQKLCVIKGVQPTLGHYLKEFCTEPTTTPPTTTEANLHRGGKPPPRGTPPLPPQTAGESNVQDYQTNPETGATTSEDGSDQVRTGFTHNEILAATIIPAVLIALAVIGFFVRRWFKQRSRDEGQNGGRRRRTTRQSGIGDVARWSRVSAEDRQTSGSPYHALLDPSDDQHTDPHQVQFATYPLHPSDDQQTHGPESRPTISSPIHN